MESSHGNYNLSNLGIVITNTDLLINGHQFSLKSIASVESKMETMPYWKPLILIMAGILFILFTRVWLMGPFLIALSFVIINKYKPRYFVKVKTTKSESKVFTSNNKEETDAIVAEINKAIIN